MTGGDCHDTLMPFSLPNPASSAHTGILTGAVAWHMDNHPSRARKGSNRGKDGENRTGKHRKLILKGERKTFVYFYIEKKSCLV